MKLFKKIWLRYQVRKYEKFLLEEGIREARDKRQNIHFGIEDKLVINKDPFSRVYLPDNPDEGVDVSPLLAMGAENNPEEARKYIVYRKMLDRMKYN